jgi:hypothetical protein
MERKRENPNSEKQNLIIKAKNATIEIVEASGNLVRIKSNCVGRVNGSLYSGGYYDTVEAAPMPDGTTTLTIKFIHVTDKGELLWGSGTGARELADDINMAKLNAAGTAWTYAHRLSQLNGKKWVADGTYDVMHESFEVIQQFGI